MQRKATCLITINMFQVEKVDGEVHAHGAGERPCNLLSTGAILLADVIPGLVIKSLSPFLPFWAK